MGTSLDTHVFLGHGILGCVRKQDRREITINNTQDANIETHYKADTNIMWFTKMGYVRTKIVSPLLLYHPTK